MGVVESLSLINKKLQDSEYQYNFIKSEIEQKNLQLQQVSNDYDKLSNEIVLDIEVIEVVKRLFDDLSSSGFRFLEDMVNQALSSVFVDEVYKFKIVLGSHGNERTAEFLLNDVPLEECGGGVRMMVSFIFRVYYIMRCDLRRVICMDELITSLAKDYLESFMGFLKLLVNKYNFDFLWISHSQALPDYADQYFEMRKGCLFKVGR
jgi:DNA repair exonuclease SbcCD ATPase subunit